MRLQIGKQLTAMLTKKVARRIVAPLVCLLLASCVGPADVKTVQAVNEPEFLRLIKTLQPMMMENKVLDQNGAWYSPRITASGGWNNAGQILLDRMSPAFRFPDMADAQLPASFRSMFTPEARIAVDSYAFTALQGSDSIYVSLLAVLDWNMDDRDDWLVLCRVTPSAVPETSRDYYLLVTNPEAPVLLPHVLAIKDCWNNICEIFDSAGPSKLFHDGNSLELMPGDTSVTMPPSSEESRSQSSATGKGIQEHHLAE